jgi:flagellar motor switch protein FliM
MAEILSQDEIDQLLTAINSGGAEDEAGVYKNSRMEIARLKSENRRLRWRLKMCDEVLETLRKIAAAALIDE